MQECAVDLVRTMIDQPWVQRDRHAPVIGASGSRPEARAPVNLNLWRDATCA
jgi:hypothetical protein